MVGLPPLLARCQFIRSAYVGSGPSAIDFLLASSVRSWCWKLHMLQNRNCSRINLRQMLEKCLSILEAEFLVFAVYMPEQALARASYSLNSDQAEAVARTGNRSVARYWIPRARVCAVHIVVVQNVSVSRQLEAKTTWTLLL